ncbi:MAG TPA: T9SS type A sorting domain-containing protein [Saprospiraceae bacterium]|nr:T9SS type A sorting domain-containing protein [Saprospiraceae bacterium]
MKKAFILFSILFISMLHADAQKVTVDSDGNIYLLGLVQDSITFADSTTIVTNNYPWESPKTYLVKLDPGGSVLWYKLFDHTVDYFNIKADHSNNLLMATQLMGTVELDSTTVLTGYFQFLIAKLDTDGNLVWYNLSAGKSNNYYISFSVDAQDNIYTAGLYSDTFSFHGPDTIFNPSPVVKTFVAKFDSSGNNLWLKKLDGDSRWVFDIDVDGSGNSVIVGEFINSLYCQGDTINAIGGFDGYWAKFDPQGVLIKMKRINSSSYDAISDVGVGRSGRFSYTGNFDGDTLFIEEFPLTINSSSIPGNFVLNVNHQPSEDWILNFTGANASKYHGVEMDSADNTYLYTLWNGHTYNSSLNSFVGSDISNANYIIKMDSSGNAVCVVHVDNGLISDIEVTKEEEIYVVGNFQNTLSLNGTTYAQIDNNTFLASFDMNCNTTWTSLLPNPLGTGIHEVVNTGNDILIFPNPATNEILLSFNEYTVKSGKTSVYSIEGTKMMELDFSEAEQVALDIEHLIPGVYIIQVITDDRHTLNGRFVKI